MNFNVLSSGENMRAYPKVSGLRRSRNIPLQMVLLSHSKQYNVSRICTTGGSSAGTDFLESQFLNCRDIRKRRTRTCDFILGNKNEITRGQIWRVRRMGDQNHVAAKNFCCFLLVGGLASQKVRGDPSTCIRPPLDSTDMFHTRDQTCR